MSDITLLENVTGQEISVIKDPFKKDCVTEINLFFRTWTGKHEWSGSIVFTNDKTTGKQDIPKCSTFEEAVAHMKTILKSINP